MRAPEPLSDRFGDHTGIPIHRSYGYGYGAPPRFEWGDEPDDEPPFDYAALENQDDEEADDEDV